MTPTTIPSGLGFILRVAALVLFILAIVAGFTWTVTTWEELSAAGLACWVGSTLIP